MGAQGKRGCHFRSGTLTAPGTSSAVSGAGSDTSQRCAPAADPPAVGGGGNVKHTLGRTKLRARRVGWELRTEIRGVVGEVGALAVAA